MTIEAAKVNITVTNTTITTTIEVAVIGVKVTMIARDSCQSGSDICENDSETSVKASKYNSRSCDSNCCQK